MVSSSPSSDPCRDLAGLSQRESQLHRYQLRSWRHPHRRASHLRQRPASVKLGRGATPAQLRARHLEDQHQLPLLMGLQNQPDAGIISIRLGPGALGAYPLVGLEVEGLASAPSFLCEYADPAEVTLRKCVRHSSRIPDDAARRPRQGTALP